jgi:hypothetical protein
VQGLTARITGSTFSSTPAKARYPIIHAPPTQGIGEEFKLLCLALEADPMPPHIAEFLKYRSAKPLLQHQSRELLGIILNHIAH